MNQGYPLTLDQQIDFTIPAGTGAELPQPQKSEEAPLRWQVEWSKSAANTLTAHIRIELAAGDLTADDTAKFQKQLDTLYSAASRAATSHAALNRDAMDSRQNFFRKQKP